MSASSRSSLLRPVARDVLTGCHAEVGLEASVKGAGVGVADAVGDGFDAGFIAARLLRRDPWEAAVLGNVVGAHALMVEGDFEGYPTMAEAEAFIAGRTRVAR